MSQREDGRHCASELKREEGAKCQECRQLLEAIKNKKTDSPPQPAEGIILLTLLC